MTIMAGESLAAARKRQEAETSTAPTWKAVSYAAGGLLVAAIGPAFRLGETLWKIGEVVENDAAGIERLERGQDDFRSLPTRGRQ